MERLSKPAWNYEKITEKFEVPKNLKFTGFRPSRNKSLVVRPDTRKLKTFSVK